MKWLKDLLNDLALALWDQLKLWLHFLLQLSFLAACAPFVLLGFIYGLAKWAFGSGMGIFIWAKEKL